MQKRNLKLLGTIYQNQLRIYEVPTTLISVGCLVLVFFRSYSLADSEQTEEKKLIIAGSD